MTAKLFSLAQPGLFLLDPERAHALTLRALEAGLYPRGCADDPRLAQSICGLHFPNPLGMAAGFDKDARVVNPLIAMGFGFVEAGTVTPRAQSGNPAPRVFRLIGQRAIINRLGFNSAGHDAVRQRLAAKLPQGVLGINIGANRDAADPVEDYAAGFRAFAPLASYIAVNISSPNTPGLRGLQAPERLDALLSRLMAERAVSARKPPILVKLAPDIPDDELPEVIEPLTARAVDGIILTNTTLSRDGAPLAAHRGEAGGLSGAPLFERSTRMLAKVYLLTGGAIPLIGVGGIDSKEAALAKIRAGASLIQLYTGMIYEGAALIGAIKQALLAHLEANGVERLEQMRGLDAERWASVKLPV